MKTNQIINGSAVVLTTLLTLQARSYDVSILKYEQQNQRSLCSQNYRKIFKNGNSYISEKKVCEIGPGKDLSSQLNRLEAENRFTFRSQELTRKLISKMSNLLGYHVKLTREWSELKNACSIRPRLACLTINYLMRREAIALLREYETLETEVLEVTSSCDAKDLQNIGCKVHTVTDPYLPTTSVSSLISESDLKTLNQNYQQVINAKKKLDSFLIELGYR